jgi:hypothetical protein
MLAASRVEWSVDFPKVSTRELSDHRGMHRTLSELPEADPLVLVLSRRGVCRRERRRMRYSARIRSMGRIRVGEGSTLKVYPGRPHGMCTVNKDQINADLLAFIRT